MVDHLPDAPPRIVGSGLAGHGRPWVVWLLVVLRGLGDFVDDIGEHAGLLGEGFAGDSGHPVGRRSRGRGET
jgi:hypothetical protein